MSALLLIAVLFTQTPDAGALAPSDDAQVAQGAINAAKNAIEQSSAKDKRESATAKLKEAESLYAQAKYAEAAKAADNAWQLVSEGSHQPTSFEVEVGPTGKTKVTSKKGQPIRVDGDGIVRPVYAGQVVVVEKGHPPKLDEGPLSPPEPLTPAPDEKVKFKASAKLLGPVKLSWKAVPNARHYEVQVRPLETGAQQPITLKVEKPLARLPALATGRYVWTVRAANAEGVLSDPAVERGFEVVRDGVKIEVQGTTWK